MDVGDRYPKSGDSQRKWKREGEMVMIQIIVSGFESPPNDTNFEVIDTSGSLIEKNT